MFDAELLAKLKAARYTPPAWPRYVRGHLALVRRQLEGRPAAVRSILATSFTFLALIFAGSVPAAIWIDAALGRRLFLWCTLWLSLHAVWLLLHLGLLADREGRPCLRLGLPNSVTLVRSVTVPGMVVLLAAGHLGLGCVLYAVGALADVADGALARRRDEVTRLGTVIDPLVDVCWNVAAAWGLVLAGELPAWILALMGVRYGLLLLGSAVLYLTKTALRIRPTLFGKASGAAIATAFMLLFLNRLLLPPPAAARLVGLIHAALGFLVSATIVYVVVLGLLNFRARAVAAAPAAGRVVGRVDPRRSARAAGGGGGGHA